MNSHAHNLLNFCTDAEKVNARIDSITRVTLDNGRCPSCGGAMLEEEKRRGDTQCGLCIIDSQLPKWDGYLGAFDAYLSAEDGHSAHHWRQVMDRQKEIALH